MDALSALWFTSVVGAVGFTATGYFLARSRIVEREATQPPAPQPEATPSLTPAAVATSTPPPPAVTTSAPPPPPVVTTSAPPPRVAPSVAPRKDLRREDGDEAAAHDEETVVLKTDTEKPERPKRGSSLAPPTVDALELERQLHALRIELRSEVVARSKIEADARELTVRLSVMSEQNTALRARVLEETSPSRSREPLQQRSSIIPSAASDARNRLSARAPGLFAEIGELKGELARLREENASLRTAALGAPAPIVRSPSPRTDLIVPEALKLMVDRIARLDHVRAAAIAESSGLVLAGSGELADALAAFGAYIRDAATRSTRLLPLKTTDEVTVRDAQGLVFSTRVLGRPESELSLVTLASGETPTRQIREIVAQTPGLAASGDSGR
jgi:predicted regulator of Ras-like GTPase activity (Roadblock/LC7/MglB family)